VSAPGAAGTAERLAALLPDAHVSTAHGVVTADVPREGWVPAVTAVRDDEVLDGGFFDCLVVVDQSPDGFEVVVRLWSVRGRRAVHLRTRCPREDATVPSLVEVFAGASWHEREGEEMFGVVFEGAPDRRRLLLPEGGVAHPLRKEHVLAARTELPWPGAEDPAYRGEGGRPPRRRLVPPGAVPEGGRR
jgi:NADH-quinone oxidoreductase subunit C